MHMGMCFHTHTSSHTRVHVNTPPCTRSHACRVCTDSPALRAVHLANPQSSSVEWINKWTHPQPPSTDTGIHIHRTHIHRQSDACLRGKGAHWPAFHTPSTLTSAHIPTLRSSGALPGAQLREILFSHTPWRLPVGVRFVDTLLVLAPEIPKDHSPGVRDTR